MWCKNYWFWIIWYHFYEWNGEMFELLLVLFTFKFLEHVWIDYRYEESITYLWNFSLFKFVAFKNVFESLSLKKLKIKLKINLKISNLKLLKLRKSIDLLTIDF